MADTGVIAVGGLATGLDTNKLIDGLVQIRSQSLNLLTAQLSDTQATQQSFGTLAGKFAAIKTAVQALDTQDEFFVRKASSSDETIAAAAAGTGAAAGSASITVTQLARVSLASAASGVSATTATVAAGNGSFTFKVGDGAEQTVALTATTTLDNLVAGINNLDAGVTASSVNLGTTSHPDYRLQLTSDATGAASNLTIVHDDSTLHVANTQTGLNAQFTVAGFTDTFNRDSNTFSDVISGVTINLKSLGTTQITVVNDAEGITTKIQAFVDAVNGVKSFVADETQVTTNDDKSVTVGTLADSSTAKRLADQLQSFVSNASQSATTQYVNLSAIGITTQIDGTLKFDAGTFTAALADDPIAVSKLFVGNGTAGGVANDIEAFVDGATGPGGTIAIANTQLSQDVTSLSDQIDAEQRAIDAYKSDLQAQFVALETLVSGMQDQSQFLSQAFG